jgi:hypothetical protein
MKWEAKMMKTRACDRTSTQYRSTGHWPRAWSVVAVVCVSGFAACVSVADPPAAPQSDDAPLQTSAPVPAANAPSQASGAPTADPTTQQSSEDLRTAIGVNPNGPKAVDVPEVPEMSVVGFVQPHDRQAMALLELADKRGSDLKRIYLVKVGTEIPVTISGHVTPIGHNELTGLSDAARPAPVRSDNDSGQETQIILTVTRVTPDGVTVKAGLLSKTIVVH